MIYQVLGERFSFMAFVKQFLSMYEFKSRYKLYAKRRKGQAESPRRHIESLIHELSGYRLQAAVYVEEIGRNDLYIYHLLVDTDDHLDETIAHFWSDTSQGWSQVLEMDKRIWGLLRFFVMKRDCPMTVYSLEIEGTYTEFDFLP